MYGLLTKQKKIVGWLMVTIALGLAFLVCQGVEYYEAYAHYGLTLSSGIFGSTFFMLTGFHGFHVFSGVILNIIVFYNTLLGTYERRKSYLMVEKVGLYWHFVDLVWVFVFTFFYLV